MSETTIVDPDVAGRVLERALQRGGEFAEIYAEDKRGTGLGLDDGRIEQVTTGRDRGAGIRVVRGDTTGFAHTADVSERGLLALPRRRPTPRAAGVAACAPSRSPGERRRAPGTAARR